MFQEQRSVGSTNWVEIRCSFGFIPAGITRRQPLHLRMRGKNRNFDMAAVKLCVRAICLLALLLTVSLLSPKIACAPAEKGSISGRVTDSDNGESLPATSVSIVGSSIGTISDASGAFVLANILPGRHFLKFSHVGFDSLVVGPIYLAAGADTNIVVKLNPHPVSVRDITVTPGTFSIMGGAPISSQTLTRDDIQSIPHFGEDIYRAVKRLPGISSNDFSARFSVRGSEYDQVLALFDGLQLYEPFHLRDVDGGALSIIDIDLIQGVELGTGGFSAVYGDRLGGVFSITPRTPSTTTHRIAAGVSFTDARLSAEGPIAAGRGAWIVSARRGYVDLVLKLMDQDTTASPVYYDTYASLQYRLSRRQYLTVNFLYADDRLRYSDESQDTANTQYSNGNFWIKLRSEFSRRLAATTILRTGSLTHHREGIAFFIGSGALRYTVQDYRQFDYRQVKEDIDFDLSRHLLLQAGVDLKSVSADYDYHSRYVQHFFGGFNTYQRSLSPHREGHQLGSYLSSRISPASFLTFEVGMRYDMRSYTGDQYLSPRSSLALQLNDNTSLRIAWGRYVQSQEIYELDVPDDDSAFYPADIAEHRVIGLEHEFGNGLQLRIEGYERRQGQLRPRYRNLSVPLSDFLETQIDRAKLLISRETARGIEVYAKSVKSRRLSWWVSYAYARITDHVDQYTYSSRRVRLDKDVPGPYDQRHTIYADIGYKLGVNWRINASWQFHSGTPYTEFTVLYDSSGGQVTSRSDLNEPYSSRYSAYHRLDLRISRTIRSNFGTFSLFLETINLYNRRNIRAYDYWYDCDGANCSLTRTPYYWFNLLPSLGIAWEWEF